MKAKLGDDGLVRVRLEDDVGPEKSAEVWPVLTVYSREHASWSNEGRPVYDWVEVVSGRAITWVERTEMDDEAGVTRETATAVLTYTGDAQPSETARVVTGGGVVYQVRELYTVGSRMELDLVRLD